MICSLIIPNSTIQYHTDSFIEGECGEEVDNGNIVSLGRARAIRAARPSSAGLWGKQHHCMQWLQITVWYAITRSTYCWRTKIGTVKSADLFQVKNFVKFN